MVFRPPVPSASGRQEKLALADPTSVEAFIKQAVAAYFVLAYGVLTPEIQRACQVHAQAIMSMHTRNPYAQDAAANCLSLVAALQQHKGWIHSQPGSGLSSCWSPQ